MKPRWYQQQLIDGTRRAWNEGGRNVVVVSPPRSGKTPTMVWLSEPFIAQRQHIAVSVHREELVRQISMTYANFGYRHTLLAPSDVISSIIHRQVRELGKSFVSTRQETVTIGSVQTINSRADKLTQWSSQVKLWLTDEAHHMLADNQWGKVASLFPNARGVGFTATPSRADRKSLARSQGGVFDAMVKGVTARQLIDEGYICDYRIIAPPSSINRETLRVGSTGDFTQKGLSSAREKSTITGDCVRTYLRYTPGEQAVVFAVDIAHATELTEAYREAGVTAETVSSKTPKAIRKSVMDKFERGIFNVLVNVDLFGEGLNVEGISVVQMARPTKSFPLYVQQFFRALTAADGKHLGTIIDHAGNVAYFGKFFGLPDAYNGWKLEADESGRRGTRDETVIPVKTCVECFMAYPGTATECPFCGHKPEPDGRDRPEQVEGDLVELTPAMLAELRAAVSDLDARLDMPAIPHGANQIVTKGIKNRAAAHRSAQDELRDAIALWAGIWRERGEADRVIHKRFWFRFGTDILTAQALGARDAESLTLRIKESYNET
jgi:DNA repair protein RadD